VVEEGLKKKHVDCSFIEVITPIMSALLAVRGEDARVWIWGQREVRRVSQAPACIWKRARGGESSADVGSTTRVRGSRKPSKPKPETTEGEEFVFGKWVLLPCGVRVLLVVLFNLR
jgi:hypothetical protein